MKGITRGRGEYIHTPGKCRCFCLDAAYLSSFNEVVHTTETADRRWACYFWFWVSDVMLSH